MGDHPAPPTAEALLAHADWVRALARTLVRDPGLADDLAQSSWLDALQHPPRDARNLRGWLAQIVRNAARQQARSTQRREARERTASRPEALPDTADLVAEAERQREVIAHVLALAEPYRSTLLLRFFRGLAPAQIAEHQGVPLATVRTRLQRALAQLRVRLDREYGERAHWCAALLPLTAARELPAVALPASLIPVGGLLVTMTWKVGAAALVIAATWWTWSTFTGDAASPAPATVASSTAAISLARPADPALTSPRELSASGERTALQSPSALSPTPTPEAPADTAEPELRRVEGRIVDATGRPVAGLSLVAYARPADGSPDFDPPSPRIPTLTAADGSYSVDVPGRFVNVESADPAWILTCDGLPVGETAQLRVAVPARELRGLVVDEHGAPLDAATITASFSCTALAEFPYVLYGIERRTWTSESAADGSFLLPQIPAAAELHVTREGYAPAHQPELEAHPTIVLRATAKSPAAAHWIRGLVLDPQGRPAVGAQVRFGPSQATSDDQGQFELAIATYTEATPLTATQPGFAAAVFEDFGLAVRDASRDLERTGADRAALDGAGVDRAAPDETVLERAALDRTLLDWVVLHLPGPALTLSGRVLEADGRPAAGWWIDLADATPSDGPLLSVERESSSAAGAALPLLTDADGRFLVEGLQDRPYRVRAFDPSRCLFVHSPPTPAGTPDLELRVPDDAILPVLRGRVLSERGHPIRGAVVRVLFSLGLDTTGAEALTSCRETQTDEHGHFELLSLPRAHLYLHVDGPHIDPQDAVPVLSAADVELRAQVRCRFRLDLPATDPADRFLVLDSEGRELPLSIQSAATSDSTSSVPRTPTGFPVCTVSERATTLVLLHGDHELRRLPLDLDPNQLQVVAR
jgi:RNA polymerase sigma-70 factor (ECF subfamily)